jgi:hypothetical protein
MCMLSGMHRVGIGMFGVSGCSSSSAAYSRALSKRAGGLSNDNFTPVGYPRPHGPISQVSHIGCNVSRRTRRGQLVLGEDRSWTISRSPTCTNSLSLGDPQSRQTDSIPPRERLRRGLLPQVVRLPDPSP